MNALILSDSPAARPEQGLLRLALRRFLQNKAALISLCFIAILSVLALGAPWVAPRHYATDDLFAAYELPGGDFLMGADFMGRDIFSRLLYGTRVSLAVAVIGALISFVAGLGYGISAALLGGRWDNLMMRVVDVLYSLPTLVVVILIMVVFRAGQTEKFTGLKALLYQWDSALGGLLFIFVGIGITSWLQMARVARGETLSVKERDYVLSAQAAGIGHGSLIWRHVLPNIIGPCVVLETATIPNYILTEAFLTFIGLGVNPPMPSWGGMINDGYQALRSYPHVILWPVVTLTTTVLAFNFMGDGLRDALDPRLGD